MTNDKTVADGQAALRDGQLDDVFGGRANALTGAFKSMKKGDALKGSQQPKSQSGNSNSGSASFDDDNSATEEESQSNIGESDSNSDAGKLVHIKGKGNAAPAHAAEPGAAAKTKTKKQGEANEKQVPPSKKGAAKSSTKAADAV